MLYLINIIIIKDFTALSTIHMYFKCIPINIQIHFDYY